MQSHYGNFIAGQWMQPQNSCYMDVADDSTCLIARSAGVDLLAAEQAARVASLAWQSQEKTQRLDCLRSIADSLQSQRREFVTRMLWHLRDISRAAANDSMQLLINQYRAAGGISPAKSDLAQMQQGRCVIRQVIPAGIDPAFLAWRTATVLASGCCLVVALIYRDEQQRSILQQMLVDVIGSQLPPGVFNLVVGLSLEIGWDQPLASMPQATARQEISL